MMQNGVSFPVIGWWLIAVLVGLCSARAQEKLDKLELPMDTNSPVLSLAYEGGFRMKPAAGFEPTPLVSLYADGRVVTGGNSPQQRVSECQLTEQFWQDLVAEIVESQQFLTLDSATIKSDIDNGVQHPIMDAPMTVITLRLANRTHRVEVYAAQAMISQVKDSVGLRRFVETEKKLRNLYAIALSGGVDVVQDVIVELQKSLEPTYPDVDRLALSDLQWCSRDQQDNLRLQFLWTRVLGNTGETQKINIVYQKQQGKVTIEHRRQEANADQ